MSRASEGPVNRVVHEFARNAREVVRAVLTDYDGGQLLHLRTFFRGESGTYYPSNAGVTVKAAQLPELEAAVQALRTATDGSPQDSS